MSTSSLPSAIYQAPIPSSPLQSSSTSAQLPTSSSRITSKFQEASAEQEEQEEEDSEREKEDREEIEKEEEKELTQPHTPGLIPPTPDSPTAPSSHLPSPSPSSPSTSYSASASTHSPPSFSPLNSQNPMSAAPPPLNTNHLSPHPTNPTTLPPNNTPNPGPSEETEIERPPNFQPFFTLITDGDYESFSTTNTSEGKGVLVGTGGGGGQTYHPSKIHYLFSDDDDRFEELSGAFLRCLNHSDSNFPVSEEGSREISDDNVSASEGWRKKGREREREERVIIVDINEKGDKVVKARTLGGGWQVVNAEICGAPIWEGGGGEDGKDGEEGGGKKGGDRGLMLRIEGVGFDEKEREKDNKGLSIKDGGSGVMAEEDMQVLLEGFDRKMAVLRRVVGAAGVEGGVEGGY